MGASKESVSLSQRNTSLLGVDAQKPNHGSTGSGLKNPSPLWGYPWQNQIASQPVSPTLPIPTRAKGWDFGKLHLWAKSQNWEVTICTKMSGPGGHCLKWHERTEKSTEAVPQAWTFREKRMELTRELWGPEAGKGWGEVRQGRLDLITACWVHTPPQTMSTCTTKAHELRLKNRMIDLREQDWPVDKS